MPRKKFDREAASKVWSKYTEDLINSISESEKEGLDRGYSSFQIEQLWQKKVRESVNEQDYQEDDAKQEKS